MATFPNHVAPCFAFGISLNPLQDGVHIYDFAVFRLKRKKRLNLE
jgi:hypothetical protein